MSAIFRSRFHPFRLFLASDSPRNFAIRFVVQQAIDVILRGEPAKGVSLCQRTRKIRLLVIPMYKVPLRLPRM